MATEIERKFLVSSPEILAGRTGMAFRQGYLALAPPDSVRIRLIGEAADARALLTVKQTRSSRSRLEFEYEIPVADAEMMLAQMCGTARVSKTRYEIEHAGWLWEVDDFHDQNAPLMLAEIELPTEATEFEIPPWLGDEVTEDRRLLNTNLCLSPFGSWDPAERAALLGIERLDESS